MYILVQLYAIVQYTVYILVQLYAIVQYTVYILVQLYAIVQYTVYILVQLYAIVQYTVYILVQLYAIVVGLRLMERESVTDLKNHMSKNCRIHSIHCLCEHQSHYTYVPHTNILQHDALYMYTTMY